MPYIPDADDAAAPLDSEFASSAASEFRTLKEKLNLLYLGSSLDADANTLYCEKGLFLINDGDYDGTLFSLWAAAGRTSGDKTVLGAQLTAVINNNVQLGATASCIGAAVLAVQQGFDTDSGAALIGIRSTVLQRNPDETRHELVWGVESLFFNRGDGETEPELGYSTEYTKNASAFVISAQRRGTEGSPCGWTRGIQFMPYCMDQDFGFPNAHSFAIDFAGIGQYDSDLRPVPFNFYGTSVETVATDNLGTYVMPTTLMGFIRVCVDDNPVFGIPLMSIPTDVPP